MTTYINYHAQDNTISIDDTAAYWLGDIGDLAENVTNGQCTVSCPLEGAKAALESGDFWNGGNVTQEALEEIHAVICEYESK